MASRTIIGGAWAKRAPLVTKLMLIGIAAVAALASSTAPSAGAAGCTGVNLTPSSDPVAAVSSHPARTTFCFAPGVYRISKPIVARDGDVLNGAAGAIIDGSRPISGWTKSGAVWVAHDTAIKPTANMGGWGGVPMTYPQGKYADDLFLDDAGLWKVGVKVNGRVLGASASTVGAGEYFIDYDAKTIRLGSNPVGHRVDLARSLAGIIGNAKGVTVTGLTVRKTAGNGIATGNSGWTISNTTTYGNHITGITGNDGAKVLNNMVRDNGQYGITGHGAGILVQGNTVQHNNAAKFGSPGGQCSAAGGAKWVKATNLAVRNNHFVNNMCNGIWIDLLDNGVILDGNTSEGNTADGIRVEVSYKLTITNNIVRNNNRGGITVLNTPDATIAGNNVSGNAGGAITLGNTGRKDPASALGAHEIRNAYVHDNTMSLTPNGLAGLRESSKPLNMAVFTSWNNRFLNNHYTIPGGSGSRAFLWKGTRVTWAQWNAAGNDRSGSASFK